MDTKKEDLNKLLWIRINQFKMLNNTLTQMIANNGDEAIMKNIKEEIDETLGEIEKIKFDLNNEEKAYEEEEKVTYSFYNNDIAKLDNAEAKLKENEKKDSGFYDSIVKQSKAAQFKMAEYTKKDNTKVDYNCNGVKNKQCDEINEKLDTMAFSNRFLVELEELVEIPSEMVKAVSFDPSMNQLVLNIYDFVKDIEGVKYPILGLLKYAPERFNFSINHFDANGKVMYVEKYHNAQIYEYYRDCLSYSSSEPSMIQIHIVYENVAYETNN